MSYLRSLMLYQHLCLTSVLFGFLLIPACNPAADYQIQKSAIGTNGMVVSAHPLATQAGVDILQQGGNAADAAIAVQFALAVVYPRAGNIGGGGFLVYRDSAGNITTLDYRETAPSRAHRDMYLDSAGQVIPALSTDGILAAGVPGTVAGLFETHQKHGQLHPWSRLLEPAIRLAENGFAITSAEADRLNEYRDEFVAVNTTAIPFVKNEPWQAGDLLVQTTLAHTLKAIANEGTDGFYTQQHAVHLDSFCKQMGGMISLEDLASYKAVWRKPVQINFRGYEIYTMPLPSSGGILLQQILTMTDSLLIDSLGYRHPHNVHLIVEAERRAYADRATFLGDDTYYPVPLDSILDQKYLGAKMKSFHPHTATASQQLVSGMPVKKLESYETTHLSIVDKDGNAASVTTTLNDNYGCKVWVPKGGYFLNNEMDDFSIKPGQPNLYGLIGGEANSIQPNKRMLSSMTPTIVEKNNALYMVLGTPGGSTIITSVLQVFLNTAVFGMEFYEAAQATRYHHQWLPDEIIVEPAAFDQQLDSVLKSYGHQIRQVERIGLIDAIYIDPDGVMHGSADRRGDDHASGW